MSFVVLVSDNHARQEAVLQALSGDQELWVAATLKELSDGLLGEDSTHVLLDVEHPRIDPKEAVRLVKGTRWDVELYCIGDGDGALRATEGGADKIHGGDAWLTVSTLLTE